MLALWDKADKIVATIDEYESTKNPESYAWFAVAAYLSTQGEGKSEWSAGRARPDGTEPSNVTPKMDPPAKAKRVVDVKALPRTFTTVASKQPSVMTRA